MKTSSKFNFTGGVIQSNSATKGTNAGAIYTAASIVITMSGGEIKGNTGLTAGAIYFSSSGVTLNMSGGSITGNTGPYGVYFASSLTFRMGGDVPISGNVTTGNVERNIYMASGVITITAPLKAGNKYDVTKPAVGPVTANFGAHNPTVKPSDVFTSGSTAYRVINDKYGKLDSGASATSEATFLHISNNDLNWMYLVGVSNNANPSTFTMFANWTAATHSNYKFSFNAGTYTADTDYYYYGALQVPSGKNVIIDLNGYTINRPLTAVYATYGYVLRVFGKVEITDSSAGGTGVLKGGWISGSFGAGVHLLSGATLKITGGTIQDNKGNGVYATGNNTVEMTGGRITANTTGYGLYIAAANVTFNLGGSAKIDGNTNGSAANIFLHANFERINIISKLTGGTAFGVTRARAHY
ncbi:MAG: hypothetical protein K2N74_03375, partial [Clostridiales bacterium]|nr:hypothetical protein [Clostridiales bacterium]